MTVRVLHSTPVWLPQTQTWMFNQVRYLPDDIDAHICCDRAENLDQFQVPNIHSFAEQPAWKRYWDKGARALRRHRHRALPAELAHKHRIDILHSHFGHEGWRDMGVARAAGLKHVVTFYGLDVNYLPKSRPVWLDRYRQLFSHVDAVLCEGPHMASCIRALGCPGEKIRVQHLGIAIEDIPFAPLDWQPGTPLKVLMAATFREKKGIPIGLEALGRLRKDAPLEVTLIGDASADPRDAAEKRKILEAINRWELARSTNFLGYQPHARFLEEARHHHVFLSPSLTASDGDTEGGAPVSLIEMSAAGMMMISTTHCDIPEVIRHQETGLLSAERDVDALLSNLRWLAEHADQWGTMRRAAREHVAACFDARKQAETLAAIYRKLLA